MTKSSKRYLLSKAFHDYMNELDEKYLCFIPCDELRKGVEKRITEPMKSVIYGELNNSVISKLNDFTESFKKDGFTLDPIHHSFLYEDDISIHMNDDQWNVFLEMILENGYEFKVWHDMPILTWQSMYHPLWFLFTPIRNQIRLQHRLDENGQIVFYGGELFSKAQEHGDVFVHSIFSFYDFDLTNLSKNQLEYFAEIQGCQIRREVHSDAIATIENLVIYR